MALPEDGQVISERDNSRGFSASDVAEYMAIPLGIVQMPGRRETRMVLSAIKSGLLHILRRSHSSLRSAEAIQRQADEAVHQ